MPVYGKETEKDTAINVANVFISTAKMSFTHRRIGRRSKVAVRK